MDAIRTAIEPSEIALRAAMLASDVEALDALLDDDLVFTVPTGQVISKEEDRPRIARSCCASTGSMCRKHTHTRSAR